MPDEQSAGEVCPPQAVSRLPRDSRAVALRRQASSEPPELLPHDRRSQASRDPARRCVPNAAQPRPRQTGSAGFPPHKSGTCCARGRSAEGELAHPCLEHRINGHSASNDSLESCRPKRFTTVMQRPWSAIGSHAGINGYYDHSQISSGRAAASSRPSRARSWPKGRRGQDHREGPTGSCLPNVQDVSSRSSLGAGAL